MPVLMVRGNAPKGQTGGQIQARKRTVIGTLLLSDFRLTNVKEITGVGRPVPGKVISGFVQAELAVDGEADFRGVLILLAVVFPPANRAQRQRTRCFQGLVSAAWATKTSLHGLLAKMDEFDNLPVYPEAATRPDLKLPAAGHNAGDFNRSVSSISPSKMMG
jgi:hypothetical protein